jgi:hypothetical protein
MVRCPKCAHQWLTDPEEVDEYDDEPSPSSDNQITRSVGLAVGLVALSAAAVAAIIVMIKVGRGIADVASTARTISGQWCCGFAFLGLIVGTVVALVLIIAADRRRELQAALELIQAKRRELGSKVEMWFRVEPCFRCQEYRMGLLEISPNGRSVHYQCLHCKKKTHAAAGTPDAPRTIAMWNELCDLVDHYNARLGPSAPIGTAGPIGLGVTFSATPAPLPYEQTMRMPIPEAIKSEVWRRDGGRCVNCGTNQNLQFDHIIPNRLGGATTVANLQLLCQSCNLAKGKKI